MYLNFFGVPSSLGETLGGQAETEQARDVPWAVSVEGARSDLMHVLCDFILIRVDFFELMVL